MKRVEPLDAESPLSQVRQADARGNRTVTVRPSPDAAPNPGPERDGRVVAFGDPLDDGEPEAAPRNVLGAGGGGAVEAVEDARPLARRDPGPRIANRDDHVGGVLLDAHVDAPGGRCVANGVVDEIRQQRPQRGGVAVHDRRRRAGLVGRGARDAEIDAARSGDRGVVADNAPGELCEVDRREAALGDARLLAREREQLLDEVRRARKARA